MSTFNINCNPQQTITTASIINSSPTLQQAQISVTTPQNYPETALEYAIYNACNEIVKPFSKLSGSISGMVQAYDTYTIEYPIGTCKIDLRLRECKNLAMSSSSSSSNNMPCLLFDKNSWVSYSMPSQIRTALNNAADVWNDLFCLDPDVVDLMFNNTDLNGITLESISIYSEEDNWLASCAPIIVADIVDSPNVKYNALSFLLNVNSKYIGTVNDNDWKWIFVHELGHALGIGTLWNRASDFWLGQNYYPLTGSAYNALVGDILNNRTLIPIEDSGGAGTAGGHWENNSRNSNYPGANGLSYPGISTDLMVGAIVLNQNPQLQTLTNVTLNNIIDMGYIPKNQFNTLSNIVPVNNINISLDNLDVFYFGDTCNKHIYTEISHDFIVDKTTNTFRINKKR